MVSVLTSPGYGETHTGGMPGSNTGDLPQTFVCLPGQLLGSPSVRYTVVAVTTSYSDDINHLILREEIFNGDRLLKQGLSKRNLVGDFSSVDLDLHDVCFLLLQFEEFGLGVTQDSDYSAVLSHLSEVSLDALLAILVSPLLTSAGVRLLLTSVPVLVESALALVTDVLSEDGLERSEPTRGLDVADNTDSDHRRSLDNGDGFHYFLLVRS